MSAENQNIIWSTENLVMFGKWLVEKGEHGYGLLCIHGSCLGIKIGSLLKLTWYDFIEDNGELYPDEEDNYPSRHELILVNEKKDGQRVIKLSDFIQHYTREVYIDVYDYHTRDVHEQIYINTKTRKVLSTTSLNKELNKLYQQFKSEVYSATYLDLKLRELKTNAFEIAWARDMVKKYNLTKKVFIAVSKHMGHRTVNDTIKLLELEPNEDIEFSYDMFNPPLQYEDEMSEIFKDKKRFVGYLLTQGIAKASSEFIEKFDKISKK